jgi:hypothetical protein
MTSLRIEATKMSSNPARLSPSTRNRNRCVDQPPGCDHEELKKPPHSTISISLLLGTPTI